MGAAAAAINASRNGYNGGQQPLQQEKPQVTTTVVQPVEPKPAPEYNIWTTIFDATIFFCLVALIVWLRRSKKKQNAETNTNGR